MALYIATKLAISGFLRSLAPQKLGRTDAAFAGDRKSCPSLDGMRFVSRRVGPEGKEALTEARRLLDNCVLFGGLSTDERAAISSRARIRTYNAGETVFSMGSPGDHMMALLSGTIRISVPAEGKELFLALIHPGEIFGELALLDGKERSADAIAESACTLAILNRDDILSFFERNPWTSRYSSKDR
jgi:CRP-like cAMP-binding protein